ncbi:malonic semialdehyde reductase [Falsirhodobacter halotolerans]|uniref:malonic semialdehyde reductase n=1 Tax=Falsirhodobacter halotolerans TaxID=1146892 RepID=UPI001FCFAAB8|nr:malonic semialdehyde reductase [Falsirhodobacter halotolerans]MCJ8139486.1 malonic semialdehyde reductase [Falsirhodobacter halotolerans]
MATLTPEAQDILFRTARTHNGWQNDPVTDDLLRQVIELASNGPTAFNQQPLRVIFVRSAEGKEKLRPGLMGGNVDKTMAAPVTAILCYDLGFWKHMADAAPGFDAAGMFGNAPDMAHDSALQNGALQAGYFILAARALGLDCGPMSGIFKDKIAEAFLADHPDWEVGMLINLGYGDPTALRPQRPRHAPEFTAKTV